MTCSILYKWRTTRFTETSLFRGFSDNDLSEVSNECETQHTEDALGVQMVFFPIPVELHSGNQGNSALNSSAISAKECRHRVKGIHIQVAEVKSYLRLRRTVSNSSTASGVPPPLLSFLVRFTTGTVSVATEVQAEAQVVVLARQRA